MKVKPVRAAAPAPQQRSALRSFLIGGSTDLSVPGYVRLIDSPDVSSAIGKVADIVSSATIQLWRNTDRGDLRVRNELAKFMDIYPYAHGTRKTLLQWLVSTMLACRNAFLLPQYDGGRLAALVPMPGAAISPTPTGDDFIVTWRGHRFGSDEVLNFPYRASVDCPWRGAGIQIQLRDILSNLRQAASTVNGFMRSEYKPSVIIKVDASADEFSTPAGRKKMLDEYVTNQSAGEPWIIPAELMDVVQVKPLSISDLAISSTVETDKRAVAAALGVPPYLLGIGAFNEAEYNAFIRTMIVPLADAIAQELTRQLLTSPDMYFKFSTRKLYAYSLKDLAGVADDQYIRGLMTGNEVRDWIDLPPEKGLDEFVILENYIPAGMIGNQSKLNGGNDNA